MCGIAGIFDPELDPVLDDLLAMVEIMHHRGPDHAGSMVRGSMAMGMRRLSIIDLTSGNQPIYNHDETIAVISNGEIYNYLELRTELEQRGCHFTTHSDTEVLVHLYSEFGIEMLKQLNGMFAFALWDDKNQSLFIVRDRMGIKPLYYTHTGQRFLFASELKSLLTQADVDRSLCLNSMADYLRLGYIPREATPYQSVYKVLPGYYLRVRAGQIDKVQWWDLKQVHTEHLEALENYDQKTEELFDRSIQLRMRSDVPVASFLSGGLDSSLISVTASRISDLPLQTYNVKFADAIFDESAFAALVAGYGKTDHHQLTASTGDVLDKLPLLLWHMDEPIADSAMIPNFLVSEFAGQQVKVCLSGLGGDELFGGYSRYLDKPPGPYRRILAGIPWLGRAILPFIKFINPGSAARIAPLVARDKRWLAYFNQIQLFDTNTMKKMGLRETGNAERIIHDLWNDYPGHDAVGQRQFIDQHTYLPDQILALTDRMSMAVSLEVRVPFLDHRLVSQAAQLPGEQKQLVSGEFKIWLKNKLGRRVPREINERKKWGFDAPVQKWVNKPGLKKIIQELPNSLEELFDKQYLHEVVNNKKNPRYHNMVWALLILAVWLKVRDLRSPPKVSLTELFE